MLWKRSWYMVCHLGCINCDVAHQMGGAVVDFRRRLCQRLMVEPFSGVKFPFWLTKNKFQWFQKVNSKKKKKKRRKEEKVLCLTTCYVTSTALVSKFYFLGGALRTIFYGPSSSSCWHCWILNLPLGREFVFLSLSQLKNETLCFIHHINQAIQVLQ